MKGHSFFWYQHQTISCFDVKDVFTCFDVKDVFDVEDVFDVKDVVLVMKGCLLW